MISFENDYNVGACPEILKRLEETNFDKTTGYGGDPYCEAARAKIRKAVGNPDADVWFLVGGTQTNMTVIAGMLKLHEGVIAANSGHISLDESGAIEYTGHKVIEFPEHDGKLKAVEVEKYLEGFFADPWHEHQVIPGMVYISWPTEFGTLYSKAELKELRDLCDKYSLTLFVDGARLGYGLASDAADVTLPELAELCDVFYIGGTKVGALFGEAVVFTKGNTPVYFKNIIKKHGGLLAKGRLLGIQFDTLFTDNLYMKISRHAMEMAYKMREIFLSKGYEMYIDSPTNQQFFIVTDEQAERIGKKVAFSNWAALDDGRKAIRFVASWATNEEDLRVLEETI
ncbi:MAG: aminotransferase class I/II-fold pyridoxal phosphate-dependent enzyme [Clostridiales bacterium]|nr:aminotransferase class I/II-fold pyridoxal phosphate-dependent enzyme [Clostridiales bacterium]